MKQRIIYILGFAAMTWMLMGCGTRENTASPNAASEVSPKETVTTEEKSSTQEASVAEAEKTAPEKENNVSEETLASDAAKKKTTDSSEISEDEAKRIALEDAGVEEQEVSGIRIKQDYDDGMQEYEVEFYVGNQEYDYEINAVSGEIRSKDMDIEDDFYHGGSSETTISEAEAKKTALEKVPGATESDIRMHLDYDDGRAIYEGSIICKGIEYDFEIDADSGAILEWEEEH